MYKTAPWFGLILVSFKKSLNARKLTHNDFPNWGNKLPHFKTVSNRETQNGATARIGEMKMIHNSVFPFLGHKFPQLGKFPHDLGPPSQDEGYKIPSYQKMKIVF
jgi:hypothetical protein